MDLRLGALSVKISLTVVASNGLAMELGCSQWEEAEQPVEVAQPSESTKRRTQMTLPFL